MGVALEESHPVAFLESRCGSRKAWKAPFVAGVALQESSLVAGVVRVGLGHHCELKQGAEFDFGEAGCDGGELLQLAGCAASDNRYYVKLLGVGQF